MEIAELKRRKSRAKANYTRYRNKLETAIHDGDSIDKIRESVSKVESAMDEATEVMNTLLDCLKRVDELKDVVKEIETVERQYDETMRIFRAHLKGADTTKSLTSTSSSTELGKDMWKQLKRVSIPIFNGDLRNYEAWKAAFYSCIDEAPATGEYKLLQMKQYLQGRALKAVEDLGHSAAAYEAAKEMLERKFGGERRKVTRYLEELDNFSPLNNEDSQSLEKFADLLDIAVVNLSEFNKCEDLKDGALCIRIQKKLTTKMLTKYHRWLFENEESGTVLALRKWVLQESEFRSIAEE